MLEVHATVEIEGPLFDARRQAVMDDLAEDCVDAVADQGFQDIHFTLARVLRNPTGYYQSQIRNRAVGSGRVLYDNRVIYGPWLEGTGSRNAPVTKFAGYFTFRRVAQALDRKAVTICQPAVDRAVRRLS